MQLRRIISSNKVWVPQIDGLRFIAIAGVVLGHSYAEMCYGRGGYSSHNLSPFYLQSWSPLFDGVSRCVPLFFVISGYILGLPFVRAFVDGGKPVSVKAFYLRRVTRLEPPYVLSLLIYFLAQYTLRSGGHQPGLGISLLTSLGYAHNFFPNLPPVNLVTWSLEVEIQFYLLAPFIGRVFLIRPAMLRRAVLVAAIIGMALFPADNTDKIGFLLVRQLCYFLVGFLLADLRPRTDGWPSHPAWDLVAFVTFPIFWMLPDRFGSISLCGVFLLFFPACLSGPIAKRILGAPPIAIIGGMCYSIYLLHMLIISGIFTVSRRLLTFTNVGRDYLVQLAVLLPAILIGSGLYFLLIERPCMDPGWPGKLYAWFGELRSGRRKLGDVSARPT